MKVRSAVVLFFAVAMPLQADVLYNNWNIALVPPRLDFHISGFPEFTITEPYKITHISTYHWNPVPDTGQGQGATPGQLWLTNVNDLSNLTPYGVWQMTGTAGMLGVPDTDHHAYPDIIIAPGTYSINDSDVGTWSANAQSGWIPFAMVEGTRVPEPATLSLLALLALSLPKRGVSAVLRSRRRLP